MKNDTRIIIGGILFIIIAAVVFVLFLIYPWIKDSFVQDVNDDVNELYTFSETRESTSANVNTERGEFAVSEFVDGWQQYANKDHSYAISMPQEFYVQDEMPNHIDISSSDYDGINENGVRIQIQKQRPSSRFGTAVAYKEYITQLGDESIVILDPSESVSVSYYTSDGSDSVFMTYVAFDEKNDVYYNILVFEPGYTNNKELIEKIVKTFIIL